MPCFALAEGYEARDLAFPPVIDREALPLRTQRHKPGLLLGLVPSLALLHAKSHLREAGDRASRAYVSP